MINLIKFPNQITSVNPFSMNENLFYEITVNLIVANLKAFQKW